MSKEPNPHLPNGRVVCKESPTQHTRRWREECGQNYHHACLELAQWFWLQQKPAQAILQLNKSMMAEYGQQIDPGRPYRALIWFLENPTKGAFIGNPVRHFQHLATRMSGPRATMRTWRAWACFYLAKEILKESEAPLDKEQLEKENLALPSVEEVYQNLLQHGFENEASLWKVIYQKR